MCDASLSFPLGPPVYVCVLHCPEGKSGMSIAELLAVESVNLTHCHQHPLCHALDKIELLYL
jgi:hypothetical protein